MPAQLATARAPSKPRELLIALLSGSTVLEAAEKLGVDKTTAYRWIDSERFQAALQASSERMVRYAEARLTARLDRAINRLDLLMENGPPENQLKAVQTVLDRVVKLGEYLRPPQPPTAPGSTTNVLVQLRLTERLAALTAGEGEAAPVVDGNLCPQPISADQRPPA